MQRRNVGKVMPYLVAVLALVSVIALSACGGNEETRNVATTTALGANTDTTHTSVAAVVGQAFTVPNGAVFNAGIGNNPVTFTFPTASTFQLDRGSSRATGTTTFGSCILTVTASSFAVGQGPQVGQTITLTTCNITVSASTVEVGGAAVSGTITLVVTSSTGTSTSSAVTLNVSILDDGDRKSVV